MAQADHQRQYSITKMYDMREEQRLLGDGSGTTKEDSKKALHHDRTKHQCVHYTAQLCGKSEEWEENIMSILDRDEIVTV